MATKSIGSAGRDYADIPSWISYLATLGALAADEIGELYNDSEFTVTAQQTIQVTTPGAFRVILRPATGQGFRDHASKLTNPLRYDQSKGVGVAGTTTDGLRMIQAAAHVTIDGVQFRCNTSDNYTAGRIVTSLGIVKNCLLQADATSARAAVLRLEDGGYAVNTVVICNQTVSMTGITLYNGSAARNCTLMRPSDRSSLGTGVVSQYSGNVLLNTAVLGPFATTTTGTFAAGSNYNATTAASITGANSVANLAFTNQIEGSTSSGIDCRAKATGGLVAGTRDQTYTADLDIVNNARSTTTPYIGAWENAAAGGGILLQAANHYRRLRAA